MVDTKDLKSFLFGGMGSSPIVSMLVFNKYLLMYELNELRRSFAYNVYDNKYQLFPRMRIEKKIVSNLLLKIPNALENLFITHFDQNIFDLNYLLYGVQFKKNKYFKYLLVYDLLYRFSKRIYFYNLAISKLIKFLIVWKEIKIQYEFYFFNKLKNDAENIFSRVRYFKNKLKYMTMLYNNISNIYKRILYRLYLNQLNKLKKIFKRQLPSFFSKLYSTNKVVYLMRRCFAMVKYITFFTEKQWWKKNFNFFSTFNMNIYFNKSNSFFFERDLIIPYIKLKRTTLEKIRNFYAGKDLTIKNNMVVRSFLNGVCNLYSININSLKSLYNLYKNKIYNWSTFFNVLTCRLDYYLQSYFTFYSLIEIRQFISSNGILINNNLVKDSNYLIMPGDFIELNNGLFFRNCFIWLMYYLIRCKKSNFLERIKYIIYRIAYSNLSNQINNTLNYNSINKTNFIKIKKLHTDFLKNYYSISNLYFFLKKNIDLNLILLKDIEENFFIFYNKLYNLFFHYKFIYKFFTFHKKLIGLVVPIKKRKRIFSSIRYRLVKNVFKLYDRLEHSIFVKGGYALALYSIYTDSNLYWIEDRYFYENKKVVSILQNYSMGSVPKNKKKLKSYESNIYFNWYQQILFFKKLRNSLQLYNNSLIVNNSDFKFIVTDNSFNFSYNYKIIDKMVKANNISFDYLVKKYF